MRFLLKFLKPYVKESVLAPLFKLGEATLELFVPLVMTAIIDRGIAQGDTSFILWMGAVLVGLATVGMIISITAQYFSARAAVCFSTDVRHALFFHITHLKAEAVDSAGTSTLITRMTSDINQVGTGLNLFLRLFLRSPFIVLGAMVMAFTIDARCALIFTVVIPVLALIVAGCLRLTIPLYKNVQTRVDRVLLHTRENLSGVRVIRAFRRQDTEKKRFAEENDELYRKQRHVSRIASLMNPLTLLVVNVGIIVLIYAGGVRVEFGGLTQGQVVALVNYMSQILVELVKLANLILNVNRALACAGRIREVFELPEAAYEEDASGALQTTGETTDDAVADGRESGESTGITCRGLSFTYPGASEDALNGIDFSVKKGETLGIIGGTGAGKSTLLSLILKSYSLDGEPAVDGKPVLSVLGRPIEDWSLAEERRRIGYVPQKSVLFSGTVRENLKMGRESASDEELWEALAASQADGFIREKEGLDTVVEAGGRNFSGGQRQRLCIARALVRKPELLILDDSFSALDTATEKALRERLANYMSELKSMVVIVSQRIASVRNADHILVLDDGCQAGFGTHEELLATCEVYREIDRIGGDGV